MLGFLKNTLRSLYHQYELVTCLNMFEPWEKKLINSIFVLVLSLILFSSIVYLPSYIQTFLRFMSPVEISTGDSSSSFGTPILHAQKLSMS